MADNRLNPWQLRENLAPRARIFAETVSESADLVLLSVLFRVNPGDTQIWKIVNPQLAKPISYNAYRYFVRQDPELLALWEAHRG